MEYTVVIIKPVAYLSGYSDEIKKIILEKDDHPEIDRDLHIAREKIVRLSERQACRLTPEISRENSSYKFVEYMMRSDVHVLLVCGRNAVFEMVRSAGYIDPEKSGSNTIRGKFGANALHNAVYVSDSFETAKKDASIFFSKSLLEKILRAARKGKPDIVLLKKCLVV